MRCDARTRLLQEGCEHPTLQSITNAAAAMNHRMIPLTQGQHVTVCLVCGHAANAVAHIQQGICSCTVSAQRRWLHGLTPNTHSQSRRLYSLSASGFCEGVCPAPAPLPHCGPRRAQVHPARIVPCPVPHLHTHPYLPLSPHSLPLPSPPPAPGPPPPPRPPPPHRARRPHKRRGWPPSWLRTGRRPTRSGHAPVGRGEAGESAEG
jgi:hypothetical protein